MSISKKIPMLKAVKEALLRVDLMGRLYGADTNSKCLGKYFVDQFWHCPPLAALPIYEFIQYCHNNGISVVIPSRDGELFYFAENRSILEEQGIHVMVSDLEAIITSNDKLLFSKLREMRGYPVIPSYTCTSFDSEYYVVKERYGAGSLKAGIKLSRRQAEEYLPKLSFPIIQPYIDGTECSADVYIDKNYKAKGVIVRERNYVEAGESQITTSFHDKSLEQLFGSIAEKLMMRGHVMFQFIRDEDGQVYIIECNARFGGASTLSIAMGLDSFYWFMQESRGVPSGKLPYYRADIEKTMIRHAEDTII
jgi:carbamoyl-phosphate synthase large subunit